LVQGYDGVVEEIGIFQTKMTLDKGLSMILPNSVFLTSGVVNMTKSKAGGRLLNKIIYEFSLSHDPEITLRMIKDRLGAKFDLKDVYVSEKNQNQKTFIVVVVFSHGNRESLIKSEILQELIRLEKILVQPYITTVHSSGS
jgi:small-conductance mechanosensitive channel